MKRFLLLCSLFVVSLVRSQAPQYLNYQGIARDASGNIIASPIGVKFEVVQGSASGTVVYDETNTIVPSAAGIFTTAIGSGVPGIGTFSSINWATGPYYLRVNIDPAGGTSYSTVGTSQLLSVPYALYAATSGNASTTYSAGNGISISSGSIINTAPNQSVSISGPAVSGTYPNYVISTPASLTASTGISVSGGTITNTAPDQIVSIVGLGSTTVGGTYPNFTISTPLTSTAATTSTLQINPPHGITNLGPNNNSITIQPTNITGPNVVGSYPNYTVAAGAAPNIIGTGVTNVITAGNNYTVNTPPVNMSYVPTTGVLTYTQASGTTTLSVLPAVTFGSSVLTIGSTPVSIPGTNIWTRPSTTVTTLVNANDNVGIGITTPNNRLHVVENTNSIAAISAVNTATTPSGNAQGLFASTINSSSVAAAVYGTNSNAGVGVSGINTSATATTAAGVYGLVMANFPSAIGVEGYGSGAATGVKGTSAGNGISIIGTKPTTAGGGNAGKFEILSTTNSADALLATTNGVGAALHAVNGPTVTGSSNVIVLLENGHIKTIQSTKPTIATSTGLGTGSSCSINGNGTDIAGEILMNTGTLATGPPYNLVQVTFNKPLSTGGSAVIILTPRSSQTAGLQLFATPIGNTGFVVGTNNTPGAFTNYQLFYYVIER